MPTSTTSVRRCPGTRILTETESPGLVYFSSVSENTRRFVDKLALPAIRIPLRPRLEGRLRVASPFVLVVPTYGGGERSGAVPRQVGAFLNDPANRALLRGVITAGNTNFGEHYCIAGPIIAAKCGIPELYRFELLGTSRDVDRVREGLTAFRLSPAAPRLGLHAVPQHDHDHDHDHEGAPTP